MAGTDQSHSNADSERHLTRERERESYSTAVSQKYQEYNLLIITHPVDFLLNFSGAIIMSNLVVLIDVGL